MMMMMDIHRYSSFKKSDRLQYMTVALWKMREFDAVVTLERACKDATQLYQYMFLRKKAASGQKLLSQSIFIS